MLNRRPYVAGSAINPGCGVVQGSVDNEVTTPGTDGEGRFIGIYPFEAQPAAAAGDTVGIVISGEAKVLAGVTVAAGDKARLSEDDTGKFATLDLGGTAGRYDTVGTFLESGDTGEYVDLFVERGSVTIPA